MSAIVASSTLMDVVDLDDIILAYLEAVDAGCPPSATDLLAQHPGHAVELMQFLRNQAFVEPLRATGEDVCLPEPPTKMPDFGAYQGLTYVGQGGYGIVWKAWDTQLKKHMALKMMRRGAYATAAEVQSFRREAAKQ